MSAPGKAPVRRDFPYIWVSWLAPLLSGGRSCEYAAWFKAHFKDFKTMPSDFNSAKWNSDHTALLNKLRGQIDDDGKIVRVESQNKFTLQGELAALGAKPDLLVFDPDEHAGVVHDAKTGKPKPADIIQVQIYMWALPLALEEYRGVTFSGSVAYRDHKVDIPAASITSEFVQRLGAQMRRIASDTPPKTTASKFECNWCEITPADCEDRYGAGQQEEMW